MYVYIENWLKNTVNPSELNAVQNKCFAPMNVIHTNVC